MRLIALLLSCAWVGLADAQPAEDCAGSPADAVTQVPFPLSSWGRVACTPQGHVITNLDGWIWTRTSGPAPVVIPSRSYFTQISFARVEGKEFDDAYAAFLQGSGEGPRQPIGYRLDAKSASGEALRLYFFYSADGIWAISCATQCDPASSFLLLDMRKKPRGTLLVGSR